MAEDIFCGWPFAVLQLLVAYLGACFGSFASVLVWRIPRGESIVRPRSHCPACNSLIPWYCNLPIFSWMALRGRCAKCKSAISARYLAMEIICAALFYAVFRIYLGSPVLMLFFFAAAVALLYGSFVDIDHYILPDGVTIGLAAAGALVSLLCPELHGAESRLLSLLRCAAGYSLGFGLLFLVSAIGRIVYKKEAMGFGDVKLMGAVGAMFGWKAVIFTLFASSLLGSLAGLALMALKRRDMKGMIPYGPFIAMGAMLWMICGEKLLDGYVRLVSPSF